MFEFGEAGERGSRRAEQREMQPTNGPTEVVSSRIPDRPTERRRRSWSHSRRCGSCHYGGRS